MQNNSDSNLISGSDDYKLPSDWQKTVDEKQLIAGVIHEDTTSSGELNTSGMPIPEMLIGRQMGSGEVVGYIGSGGMGDVYKIWNENVSRYHAVKLLKPGSNEQAEKRFEREIKVTAAFDHSNIVHVYGAGRWKKYLYLEMEYIEGNSLDALLLRKGPFPPAVCTAIGIMVASALHYAHNHSYTLDGKQFKGVIHRDLKPANIMLSNDGRLKLMDFGIAKSVGNELATLTMGLVGSWLYLSPEQLDNCTVDYRVDIYTLGEVLYELLTGKPPFACVNQREFLNDKIKGKYPSVNTVAGNVPGALIKIVDKCMKVNPDSRFHNALDLGNELKAVHRSLTDKTPEEVLSSFLSGNMVEQKKNQSALKPEKSRRLFTVVSSVLIISLILLVLLLFSSGRHSNTSEHVVSVTADNVKTPEKTDRQLIMVNARMSAPALLSPVDKQMDVPEEITFIWQSVTNEFNYRIQVSADSSFGNIVIDSNGFIDTAITLHQCKFAKTYYWRVKTENAIANGSWSSVFSFTVQDDPDSGKSHDYGVEAQIAIKANRLADADSAIKKMSQNDFRKDTLYLRLIEKYLDNGNKTKANNCLRSITTQDMFVQLLKGRLLIEEKKYTDAFNVLDMAQSMGTKFNSEQVRKDVTYFRAVAANATYNVDKSDQKTKNIALEAWRSVFNLYKNNRLHPRCIEATHESSRINE